MHEANEPMGGDGYQAREGSQDRDMAGGSMFDRAVEARGTTDEATMSDDLIGRARALYEANPALVIAGATAVAALGVLLLRAQSRREPTTAKLRRDVDDFLRKDDLLRKGVGAFVETQKQNSADVAQMVTSMVTGAMAMQPATLAAFRDLAGSWLQTAGRKAEDLGKSVANAG